MNLNMRGFHLVISEAGEREANGVGAGYGWAETENKESQQWVICC